MGLQFPITSSRTWGLGRQIWWNLHFQHQLQLLLLGQVCSVGPFRAFKMEGTEALNLECPPVSGGPTSSTPRKNGTLRGSSCSSYLKERRLSTSNHRFYGVMIVLVFNGGLVEIIHYLLRNDEASPACKLSNNAHADSLWMIVAKFWISRNEGCQTIRSEITKKSLVRFPPCGI